MPDGWGRQTKELAIARDKIRKKAEEKVKTMQEEGIIPQDDDIARRAVQVLLEIAEGPDAAAAKASAAKALLEFTKQKPTNKVEVKAVAEQWLASLDDDTDESEEDSQETV